MTEAGMFGFTPFSPRFLAAAVAVIVGLADCLGPTAAQDLGPLMPHEGGEITTAFTNSFGPDAESYFRFVAVTPRQIDLDYTSTRGLKAQRTIAVADRQNSQTYVIGFANSMPKIIPGTTSLGISGQTLVALRDTGQAPLSLVYDAKLSRMDGVLRLLEAKVRMSLLVENQLTEVPAVHAAGEFSDGRKSGAGEFWFLDNKNNPLMLQSIIKFSWEKEKRTEKIVRVVAGASMRSAMEQSLATLRKYDVYGIHFDFDKATIRGESATIIRDIAVTLKNNPLWTLQINGYTDSIGDDGYNLKLSQQRAAAVRAALIKLGVGPDRLQSAGYGESSPKADNGTLQGRALNRRVELQRTDR
jgi:outer membrane protein OmpA-like peptidoglycan-associated protein